MNKQKIRVMHIVEAAGGVDRYLKSFLKYMDKELFENILVCSENFHTDEYKYITWKTEMISMKHDLNVKHDVRTILQIRKLIKYHHPDIVYAHSSKAGFLVRIANVGTKSKCIYNPHGWAFNMECSKTKQIIYRFAERVQAPLCDKIICISDAEKRSAIKWKICDKNKIHVIYNGIDFEEIENAQCICKADIGIPEEACVIGTVGRLTQQKAPEVFIKAARIIKNKYKDTHFVMVGDGTEKNSIMELVNSFGMNECVHITGWVDNPVSYMKLFDVGMLLSRWEGFGLVLPEYMLSNVPIVATRIDAIPDLIENGVNGTLIDVDDEKMAADAVIQLVSNDNLKEKYKENGMRIVQDRFDVRRVAFEHQEIFRKIMVKE